MCLRSAHTYESVVCTECTHLRKPVTEQAPSLGNASALGAPPPLVDVDCVMAHIADPHGPVLCSGLQLWVQVACSQIAMVGTSTRITGHVHRNDMQSHTYMQVSGLAANACVVAAAAQGRSPEKAKSDWPAVLEALQPPPLSPHPSSGCLLSDYGTSTRYTHHGYTHAKTARPGCNMSYAPVQFSSSSLLSKWAHSIM